MPQQKNERMKKENDLTEEINQLQKELDFSSSYEKQRTLEEKQYRLQNLRENKMNGLLVRCKAQWAAQGEKNTKYFCNLEKRNYIDRLMPQNM